jgi:hypothetical protein
MKYLIGFVPAFVPGLNYDVLVEHSEQNLLMTRRHTTSEQVSPALGATTPQTISFLISRRDDQAGHGDRPGLR